MTDSSSSYHTSPSLLLRIRDTADQAAWSTFVEIYTPLLFRVCRARGLDDHGTADVVQEVLLQVARSIRQFDYRPEKGRFRDWLGTVARHEIGRHVRRASRPGRGLGGEQGDAIVEGAESARDASAWSEEFNAYMLHTARERIRPEFDATTWRAFELLWDQERTPSEVAAQVARPIGWVYKVKFKVLRRLEEEVRFLAEDIPHLA